MSNLLKEGKGEGDVLDSAPSRPVWYLGYDRYIDSWSDTSYFKVKFCLNCRKAFEFFYSQTFKSMVVDYYKDFPSISCEKEVCPKCQ